jgi:Lon protease-like protein
MVAGAYRRAADLPQVIPVFPLDEVLLLPHGQLPLNIFEPRYLNMVDDAMAAERVIGMIQTLPGGDRQRPSLAAIGCLGRITRFAETSDGRYLITLTGVCRFSVRAELSAPTPYRQARVDYMPFEADLKATGDDDGFDRILLLRALRAYLERRSLEVDWEAAKSAPGEALINSLAMLLPFDAAEKQALLEAMTLSERREALIALMEIDAAGPADDDGPPSLQ